MSSTLIILSLNEIDGVKVIMPRVKKEWFDEILLVDGGSTDGTIEWFKANQPYVKIINQVSKGVTGAYWEGIEAATSDIVMGFSPDNNCIPELIPSLIDKMKEGYDMVCISRYKNAKSYDDDIITRFGNWMFTTIINVLFRGHYTDCLGIFRAFRRTLPVELRMKERNVPVFEVELSIKCLKNKSKIMELPGDEPARLGGLRKMNPLYNGWHICRIICKEFFRIQ